MLLWLIIAVIFLSLLPFSCPSFLLPAMLAPDGLDDASSVASGSAGAEELKGPKKTEKNKHKKEVKRRKKAEGAKEFEASINEAKATTDEAMSGAPSQAEASSSPTRTAQAASQAPPQAAAKSATARPAAAASATLEVADKGNQGKERRRKPPKQQQKWSDDQWAMLQVVMKLVMQCVQGVREVSGILFDVFLLPAAVHSVHAAGQALCTCNGGGWARPRAPPHLCVRCGLTYISESASAIDVDRQNLENWKGLNIEQRCELVKSCKVAKLFDQTQRKAVLAFGPGPEAAALRSQVLTRLKAEEGFVFKVGKAPPGNLERQLSQFLDSVVG